MKIHVSADGRVASGKWTKIVESILSTTSLEVELTTYSTYEFDEPADLLEWASVLNLIDATFHKILIENESIYLPEKSGKQEISHLNASSSDEHLGLLNACLRFTSSLLKNSFNKEVYSSTEYLLKLLRAYDDQIAMLALEALTALASPPQSHRCLSFAPHTTAMHKASSNCIPLFQIVEAANWSFPVIAEDFLSADYTLTDKHTQLEFDISQRPKVYGSDVTSDMSPSISQSLFSIDHVDTDPRTLRQILADAWLPHKYLFALMWRVRLQRLMGSVQGRVTILLQQYRAILILLCCHPNSSVLSHFFQDKTDLLRDFVFMVRTGPGSSDYKYHRDNTPLELRLLACQCLVALVGSRDSATVSVMGRFSWLQQDLGVNRGQYMGLLPCVLRSATSFLCSLSKPDEHSADSDSSTPKTRSNANTTAIIDGENIAGSVAIDAEPSPEVLSGTMVRRDDSISDRLIWTENLVVLTLALVSVTNALPALVENGFISLLVSIIKQSPFPERTSQHTYVEALVVQLVEMSLSAHQLAISSFKDLCGIDAVLERLLLELLLLAKPSSMPSTPQPSLTRPRKKRKRSTAMEATAFSTAGTNACSVTLSGGEVFSSDIQIDEDLVTSANKVLIHSLLTVLSLYLQEASDSRQGQILRGPMFTSVFLVLFNNSRALTASILTPTFALFSEVINNDPSILSSMVSCGLVNAAVASIIRDHRIFNGDCLLSASNCLSAISLLDKGRSVVICNNPFPALFGLFHTMQFTQAERRTSAIDLPNSFGVNIEELLRHHPPLLTPCIKALVGEMNLIASIAESYSGITMEDEIINHPQSPGVTFTTVLQFCTGILTCLESVLSRKENVIAFISLDGVKVLSRLLSVAHRPHRYVIASFSCSTDPTTHSLGHFPVVRSVTRCFSQITEREPKNFISELSTCITHSMDTLKARIQSFWGKCGSKPTLPEPNAGDEFTKCYSVDGDVYHISSEFFLHKFLDAVSRFPLQNTCTNDTLTCELKEYASVLQEFMVLDYLVEGLSLAIQSIMRRPNSRSSLNLLTSANTYQMLRRLTEEVYIGSQQELCRARGGLTDTKKSERVRVHPIYRLLVISNDPVSVRDSQEDNGKRLYKLEKGTIVNAFERATGNDNLLRYHIDDGSKSGGWVTLFRSSTSLEPQIEVIDTIRGSEEDEKERISYFEAKRKLVSSQKRFDFDKVANVSARRGGFMTLFHFHCCMRHLLCSLAWTCSPLDDCSFQSISESSSLSDSTAKLLPLICNCLARLLPSIPQSLRVAPCPSADTVLRASTAGVDLKFFVAMECPDISEFSIEKTFRTIHVVELCHYFLFEENKGRGDPNILLLAHLYYGKFIEKLALTTSLVFLTCMRAPKRDKSGDDAGGDESSEVASILDYSSPVECDDDYCDDSETTADCSDGSSPSKLNPEKFLNRKLKDRQMLAVSNVDIVIDLWKHFFREFLSTSRSSLALVGISDDSHAFDPDAFKRKLYMTLVRYISQTWSHDKLHTLPPTTVRNVLDLVQVVIKSLSVAKEYPLRFSGSASRERSRSLSLFSGRRHRASFYPSMDDDFGYDPNSPYFHRSYSLDGGDVLSDITRARTSLASSEPRFPIASVESQSERTEFTVPNNELSSLNDTIELSIPLSHALPAVSKATDEELNGDKSLMSMLYKSVYTIVPQACRDLIEKGIRPGGVQWRTESALFNQSITREFTTVMVLTQMLKCLERPNWSDGTLKIIILSALYPRAETLLKKKLTPQICSSLYGLLHAILLLLSGKVGSVSRSNEMMFLIFGREGWGKNFYELLLSALEDTISQVNVSSSNSLPDNSCIDWISPALLILDAMAQPVLVEKANVEAALVELGKVNKPNKADNIISPELKESLRKRYLRENTMDLKALKSAAAILGLSGATDSSSDSTCLSNINASGSAELNSEKDKTCRVPLVVENGLTQDMAIRAVHVCLDLMGMLPTDAKRSSSLYQALIQLLVHITRNQEVRNELLKCRGIRFVLKTVARFEDSSTMVYTLLQHLVEDEEYLTKAMESAMKLCIQRVHKSETKGPFSYRQDENSDKQRVSLKRFLEMLCPLLYRNQYVFMKVFRSTMRVYTSRGTEFVTFKSAPAEATHSSSSDTKCTVTDNTEQPPSTTPLLAPSHMAVVQSIVDELLVLLFRQWVRLGRIEQEGAELKESNIKLPIAEILIILGDLVTSVPGLATCLHKFDLVSVRQRLPEEVHDVLSMCLQNMRHAVTGEALNSTHFMAFLVHYLVVSKYTTVIGKSPVSESADTSSEDSVEKKESKTAALIVGSKISDAPSYLLAALVARPGDGRRRSLKELLGALKLHGCSLDSTDKLKAVAILATTIQGYHYLKPSWRQSEMLVLPTKDIFALMTSLKYYRVLSDAMCAIKLDHPLAHQAALFIAGPLETFIKKGLQDSEGTIGHAPVTESKRTSRCRSSSVGSGDDPSNTATTDQTRVENSTQSGHSQELSDNLPIEDSNPEFASVPEPSYHEDDVNSSFMHSEDEEEEDEDDDDDDDDDDEDDELDDDDEDDDDDDDDHIMHMEETEEIDDHDDEDDDGEDDESEDGDAANFHHFMGGLPLDIPTELISTSSETGMGRGGNNRNMQETQGGDRDREGNEGSNGGSVTVVYDHDGVLSPQFSNVDRIADNDDVESGNGSALDVERDYENMDADFNVASSAAEDDDAEEFGGSGFGVDELFVPSGDGIEDEDDEDDEINGRGEDIESIAQGLFGAMIPAARSDSSVPHHHGAVHIHHNREGVQVHIHGNEAMRDFLQHLPTPTHNPRLQRSGRSNNSDMRSFFSQVSSVVRGGSYPRMERRMDADRMLSRADAGVDTSQPGLHPLLAVTDPRQAREMFTPTNSGYRGQAMVEAILSAYESHGRVFGGPSMRPSDSRQTRLNIAGRRRSLNPVVSDRRWGTDVGEIEVVGSRLQPLLETFTDCISDEIERTESDQDINQSSRMQTDDSSDESKEDKSIHGENESKDDDVLLTSNRSSSNTSGGDVTRSSSESTGASSPTSFPTGTSSAVQTGEISASSTSADGSEGAAEGGATESDASTIPTSVHSADSTAVPAGGNSVPSMAAEGSVDATDGEARECEPMEVTVAVTGENSSISDSAPPSAPTMQCPEGVDQDVWNSLPYSVQLELAASNASSSVTGDERDLLESTELDRETLEALPPDMRSEILREEAVERRRRQSFDETGNPVASTSDSGATTSTSDNYGASFLSSLPFELRQEALLSVDEDFISTLPADIQAEARQLQREHGRPSGNILPLVGGRDEWEGFPGVEGDGDEEEDGEGPITIGRSMTRDVGNRIRQGISRGHSSQSNSSLRGRGAVRVSGIESAFIKFDDNISPSSRLPFGRNLPVRLLLQLHTTRRARLSKPLLKLTVAICKYNVTRRPFMSAIMASMFHDRAALESALHVLQCGDEPSSELSGKGMIQSSPMLSERRRSRSRDTVVSEDGKALLSHFNRTEAGPECVTPVTLRRLLNAIYYLCRKTEKRAWYDMMHQERYASDSPSSTSSRYISVCGTKWMFGQLLELLNHPSFGSNANIDMVLHVIQEILEPISHLRPSEVQALIARQGSLPADDSAGDSWDRRKPKRVRIAEPVVSGYKSVAGGGGDGPGDEDSAANRNVPAGDRPGDVTSSSDNVAMDASNTQEGQEESSSSVTATPRADSDTPTSAKSGDTKPPGVLTSRPVYSSQVIGSVKVIKCDLPFPVLDYREASTLAGVVRYEECGGSFPSRLSRILHTLCLHDGNWRNLLSSLRSVAEGVALKAIHEARSIRMMLANIIEQNGNAALAMAFPHLSTPSTVSELRLLHVLRLITSLRDDGDGSEEAEATNSSSSSVVASVIGEIDFQDLWDLLVSTLDLVRNLEGINDLDDMDVVGDEGPSTDATVSSSSGSKEKVSTPTPTLSSLTMRFVPLIECFLTVCRCTVLKGMDEFKVDDALAAKDDGLTLKRKSSSDIVSPGRSNSTDASSSDQPQGQVLRIKKAQMPGLRFRQKPEFKNMQQELDDSVEARRLLTFVEKNSMLLNMVLKQNVNLLDSSFAPLIQIPRCRAMLHFDIKRAFFKMKLKKMKKKGGRQYEISRLKVNVRRQSIFEDSFQRLRDVTADVMRRPLSVTFHGEDGIDAGGVTREWYSSLAKEIFNENYALFVNATHDNVTFQPNPLSAANDSHLAYFKFVGRIIGKAICDGQLLDAHFTRSFYKHILGVPVSYHDLEATEPEFYKGLIAILEHPLDLLGMELTFSAELNVFGSTQIVDLVEGGRNIPVTDENKLDYVRLVAHHRMTAAINKQIDQFLEGFHELVPPELVSIFDAQELELLISGLPDIDLDDLRAHTDYQGYKSTDPVISYFWSALRSFSQEEKALFLQFVTGTSKVPLDGFQALRGNRGIQQFSIHKAYGTHLLPCAHTCFNQLDLPEYASEEELKEKLLVAIREGSEGFGIA